jgi:hypothetical protein
MASETRTGLPTERPVEPVMESSAALMVVDPAESALATPLKLMVATAWFEDVQLTTPVKFSWLPSLKFPVAVNVTVFPSDADEFVGVTVILVNVAEVTLRVAVFEIDPEVAVMLV